MVGALIAIAVLVGGVVVAAAARPRLRMVRQTQRLVLPGRADLLRRYAAALRRFADLGYWQPHEVSAADLPVIREGKSDYTCEEAYAILPRFWCCDASGEQCELWAEFTVAPNWSWYRRAYWLLAAEQVFRDHDDLESRVVALEQLGGELSAALAGGAPQGVEAARIASMSVDGLEALAGGNAVVDSFLEEIEWAEKEAANG